MATKKNPTNADIYRALGALDEKVDAIHIQVRSTNGRVTRLEQWKNGLDAVAQYKKDSGTGAKTSLSPLEKKLIAIIMALITLAGAAIAAGKV